MNAKFVKWGWQRELGEWRLGLQGIAETGGNSLYGCGSGCYL